MNIKNLKSFIICGRILFKTASGMIWFLIEGFSFVSHESAHFCFSFYFPLVHSKGFFLFGICLEGTKNGIVYIQNGVVILISNI